MMMVTMFSRVLAGYLLTERGQKAFTAEYEAQYRAWQDAFKPYDETPEQRRETRVDAMAAGVHGGLELCANQVMPPELQDNVDALFSDGFYTFDGWKRSDITAFLRVEPLAKKLDSQWGERVRDVMPKFWQ